LKRVQSLLKYAKNNYILLFFVKFLVNAYEIIKRLDIYSIANISSKNKYLN